jgi:hypothetical protein
MDDKFNGSVLLFSGDEHDKAALERAQRTVVDRIKKNILTFGSLLKDSKLNINKEIQVSVEILVHTIKNLISNHGNLYRGCTSFP